MIYLAAIHLIPLLLSAAAPGEEPLSGIVLEELASPAGDGTGMPGLSRSDRGLVVLSWLRRGTTRGQAALCVSTLDESGWSEPSVVASGDDWFVNWADVPATAALSDATLVASWLEKNARDTYAYLARFAISRDAGQTWSPPLTLHDDDSPVEHGFVSFAPLDDTRFMALWLDGRNTRKAGTMAPRGATALLSRTIDVAQGAIRLSPESVVDPRVCDCCPTSLIGSGTGGLVCLYRDRSEDEVRDIGYAFFTADGWSVPAAVHEDGWRIHGCPVAGPSIARKDDLLAAAWYTEGGGAGQVFVAQSGPDGFGEPRRVDDGSPLGRVDVCFLADGSLIVTWMEQVGAQAAWRARLVAFGEEPAERPAATIDEVSPARSSGHLRIVPHGDGAILAWPTSQDTQRVVTRRLRLE